MRFKDRGLSSCQITANQEKIFCLFPLSPFPSPPFLLLFLIYFFFFFFYTHPYLSFKPALMEKDLCICKWQSWKPITGIQWSTVERPSPGLDYWPLGLISVPSPGNYPPLTPPRYTHTPTAKTHRHTHPHLRHIGIAPLVPSPHLNLTISHLEKSHLGKSLSHCKTCLGVDSLHAMVFKAPHLLPAWRQCVWWMAAAAIMRILMMMMMIRSSQ